MGNCTYYCSVYDCLKGLELAIRFSWYSFNHFDVYQYQHYERVENGDLNWIVPNKFLAFSGPQAETDSFGSFTPEDYIPVFK